MITHLFHSYSFEKVSIVSIRLMGSKARVAILYYYKVANMSTKLLILLQSMI